MNYVNFQLKQSNHVCIIETTQDDIQEGIVFKITLCVFISFHVFIKCQTLMPTFTYAILPLESKKN